jgi:hypothetical protein
MVEQEKKGKLPIVHLDLNTATETDIKSALSTIMAYGVWTPEMKSQMSATMKGKWTPERRQAMSKAMSAAFAKS